MTPYCGRCGLRTALLATLAYTASASASVPPSGPNSAPARTMLPQKHEYQRVLRGYMAGLGRSDFTIEKVRFRPAPPEASLDQQFKMWLLLKGRQYEAASVIGIPAGSFTLREIEGRDEVLTPLLQDRVVQAAWLAGWRHPCNPYFESTPLKTRTFVGAAIDLVMLDALHEGGRSCRSDLTCGPLVRITYAYMKSRDAVPVPVRSAFRSGILRVLGRVDEWGPTGINGNMDFFGTVSLWYAWEATRDPEARQIAVRYLEKLLTPPRYWDPAGYTRDAGIVDMSYEGITRFFLTWGALAGDLPISRAALEQSYRLKSHTCVPEPDGVRIGPSNMSARTSAGSAHDQWGFHFRDYGAAMLTDWALPWISAPSRAELGAAPERLVSRLNQALDGPAPGPAGWQRKGFVRVMNYAHEHFRDGFADRLLRLAEASPELFKLPFERPSEFVEALGEDFVCAKLGKLGAIIHTGPTSGYGGVAGIKSPWGFGGGQLSAFWTPETGSVVLGRRRSSYVKDKHDSYEEWREWPSHAVSGLTPSGKVVSSARIRRPAVRERKLTRDGLLLVVAGELPSECNQQGRLMRSPMDYERTFALDREGLTVTTTVEGNGADSFAELYEVIPVFLCDKTYQPGAEPARILFRSGAGLSEATPTLQPDVEAIIVERWNGSVVVAFDTPQAVKLSPAVWQQTQRWMGDSQCRNVLVDLLARQRPGHPLVGTVSLTYRIVPGEAARPGTPRGAAGEEPAEGAEPSPETEEKPKRLILWKPPQGEKEEANSPGSERDRALARLFKEAEGLFVNGEIEKARELFARVAAEGAGTEYAKKAEEYLAVIE